MRGKPINCTLYKSVDDINTRKFIIQSLGGDYILKSHEGGKDVRGGRNLGQFSKLILAVIIFKSLNKNLNLCFVN